MQEALEKVGAKEIRLADAAKANNIFKRTLFRVYHGEERTSFC